MICAWSRFLPRKTMEDVNRSVRSMLSYAYHHVPFYRELYDRAGVHPDLVRSVDDLPLLPVISRLELMAGGPASYLNRKANPEKLTVKHTTGTTGNPVTVYMNFAEQAFRKITMMDAYSRNTWIKFPLRALDVGTERKDAATTLVSRTGPHKRVRLFRGMPMDEQIDLLFKTRPSLIAGRPSTLWELALALSTRGLTPPRPAILISNVEMLFPHVRRLLEDVFRCKVHDCYNCEEAGNLAWQCPKHPDRMHPNTAVVWIEILDANNRPLPFGREGRVVITNLFNRTMPFIRYSMGDRAVLLDWEKCDCGHHGPVMRLTEGRSENFIVLPDGREVSPRIVFDLVNRAFPYDTPGWNMIDAIRTFQIIQETEKLIVIKVVPGPAYSDSLWPKVERNLRELHPALRLNVELVDDLTPAPGKKFHQVLGKLGSRWTRAMENVNATAGEQK